MNFVKKHMKNERGLTLIELLAVVVILGIIAAIAIPSIGGLMKNSEKDAHIANAQQIASAARLYITENGVPAAGTEITLKTLEEGGYIENISDPSKEGESYTNSSTTVTYSAPVKTTTGNGGTAGSGALYKVVLMNGQKSYINSTGTAKDASKLTRDDITL